MSIYNNITILDDTTNLNSFIERTITSINEQDLGNITSIRNYAFLGCTSLTSITIPNSVTRIGARAFEFCRSLTSFTIPNSVITMGENPFYGCESLTSVIVLAITPPYIESSGIFQGTPIANGTGYIYVPANAVDTYKAASGWSSYASQIVAIPE